MRAFGLKTKSRVKSFVCSNCQAITKRFEGALPPSFCPFCRGTSMFEVGVKGERPGVAPSESGDLRPCERGEPCARLSGMKCPGGRGC
jgi:hypothetical protein